MKLDHVKILFGTAALALCGAIVACGGDDEPGAGSSSGSSGVTSSSSGGSSGTTSSSGGSSGTTSSSSGGSSSGGTACFAPTDGACYKTTLHSDGIEGNATCPAQDSVTFTVYEAPEPTDAGTETDAANPCQDNGSDEAACLLKSKCDFGSFTTESETNSSNGKSTTTTSVVMGDADACVTTITTEPAEMADCEADGGDAG